MSIQASQPWLYEIFKRTLEARKLRKNVQTHVFKNSKRREFRARCPSCAELRVDQQCVQHRVFTRRSYPYVNKRGETIDSVLGCGISKAPLHDRMRPAKLDPSAPIYHPEHDLDLEPIRSDPEILERCGRMIVYIYDSEEKKASRKPLFFVAFGAIPEDVLSDLDRHGENIALTVPKLKRGRAMEVYGFGEMRARGARIPMGGTRGDGYAAYRSTDALTVDGIRAQFDHAENATVYMEIARSIDPDLVRELEAQSRPCERLGQFGANLYSCRNYCAPQHLDRDACRSICSQEAWMGRREYDEWGFAQPRYGFFIATETNTLWSFDSSDEHGTVLPCRSTLEEISLKGGGAQAYSRGKHSTTQSKNRNRAEEYLRARQTWNARTDWWQKQCSMAGP
ncbi:hypothetical protein K523DRAFT_256851 [Schizophyllum commune Tattone D]|nr:hypothetical protein K523DRAFT_256851 [Schizophyllum commune Tattone D]